MIKKAWEMTDSIMLNNIAIEEADRMVNRANYAAQEIDRITPKKKGGLSELGVITSELSSIHTLEVPKKFKEITRK